MKKLAILVGFLALLLTAAPASAQTIDGTIGVGEWDAYFLGTSTTPWGGGTSVGVYGYADSDYLYAAYVADTTEPGWSLACILNINANLYYKTPTTVSWPASGYTILEMVFPRVQQTDGSGWSDIGTLAANGVEYAFIDMFSVSTSDCQSGAAGNNIAEFKIPLSLLTYAGDDGQILLNGQYWQYDFATSYFVELAPPTKADILTDSGVPGKGLENAPGLQKPFNPKSKAAENAGKK